LPVPLFSLPRTSTCALRRSGVSKCSAIKETVERKP
jgi:hypothetical protein